MTVGEAVVVVVVDKLDLRREFTTGIYDGVIVSLFRLSVGNVAFT